MILRRRPACNIMTTFGILMPCININQAMLMFSHMNLSMISVRASYTHQSTYFFPSLLRHRKVYQSGLIEKVKNRDDESRTWSGDGLFDSMGHSVKYGVYTVWSSVT